MWKDIEGFEGIYQVSDDGLVRSCDRWVCFGKNGGEKFVKGIVLKPRPNNNGYLRVQLSKDGVSKDYYIHILVATAYIPNVENKPQVDHINCDKTDNRVENLRWVTCQENRNNPLTAAKFLKTDEEKKETARRIYHRNKEKIAIRRKELYWSNHSEKIAKRREYEEKNKEHIQERNRQWYKENKEIISEKGKEYYSKNKDRISLYGKKWRENNRDEYNAYMREYRKRRKAEGRPLP